MKTTDRRLSPYPWLAFAALCLTAVVLLRDTPRSPQVSAIPAPVDSRAADALETANALQLTALVTPTATATRTPTPEPTSAPTVDPSFDDCAIDQKPGTFCQLPPLPTATVSPFPSCSVAEPGQWCKWEDV